MKLAGFLIPPMLCDFSRFYRQLMHDSDYPDYTFFPDSTPAPATVVKLVPVEIFEK